MLLSLCPAICTFVNKQFFADFFLHNPTSTFAHIRYVSYRPEFENIDPVVKQNE